MTSARGRSFALLPLLLGLACRGGGAGAASTSESTASASTATSGGSGSDRDWAAFPAVFTFTGATEIDALGDIHGDPSAMVRVLRAGGVISSAGPPYTWTGGSRILIVTGDVIDKGDKALTVIDILSALEPQAKAAGGHLVVTLGNHEAEFLADPKSDKTSDFQAELEDAGLDPAAVAAGASPYGAWLRTRPLAALIDGWFFSHGGSTGGRTAAGIAATFQAKFEGGAFGDPFLIGDSSVLEAQVWWTTESSSTQVIDHNLTALPAAHLVFGHDPGKVSFPDDPQGTRAEGEMVMRYEGRIFMIDTGMSDAVGYTKGALLRIQRGSPTTATAVHADGTTKLLWSGD
jgi:hypothetical protein